MYSIAISQPRHIRVARALRASMVVAALATILGAFYLDVRFPTNELLDAGIRSALDVVLFSWILVSAVGAFGITWISNRSSAIALHGSMYRQLQHTGLIVCAAIDGGVITTMIWPHDAPDLGRILVNLIAILVGCGITVSTELALEPSS